MNFIGAWCKQNCGYNYDCNKCYRVCIPRLRLAKAVGCSEHLLWSLIFGEGNVTHPNIADRITDYIGGTSEDRDSIVAKEHHGKYKPNHKNTQPVQIREAKAWNAKAVVAIDRLGFVISRYPSIEIAAESIGAKKNFVSVRCNKTGLYRDEFNPCGMSFRFETEWKELTPEQRQNDIQEQKERYKCKHYH